MDATMTWGDALWDVSIAFTSIIFINIALGVRIKGKKSRIIYLIICLIYLVSDLLIFFTGKNKNWFIIYFFVYIFELCAIYLAGYLTDGDIWRNVTYVAMVQILVGVLLGITGFFIKDVKTVLYNDGLYRIKNSSFKIYFYVSVLQVTYALFVSFVLKKCIKYKNNYIAYKLFFLFYIFYGFVATYLKARMYANGKFVLFYVWVLMQFGILLLSIYIMVYMYNKSIRKIIENELKTIDINQEEIINHYNKIVYENKKLSDFKANLKKNIDKITFGDNEQLKNYIEIMNDENIIPRFNTNPLVGNLIIDVSISYFEKKLKSKNTVFELTVGSNCDKLLMNYEKIVAYVFYSLSDLSECIEDDAYVVIGIRNKCEKLFISVNMVCKTKIILNKTLNKLINYIRIEKGFCIVKSNEYNECVDIIL